MSECAAFLGVDIQTLNERECAFLLDVLQAIARNPTTLPAATRNAAASSLHDVEQRLRRLERHGLVRHESPIRSGHLVPEFSLTDQGRSVHQRAGRGAAHQHAP